MRTMLYYLMGPVQAAWWAWDNRKMQFFWRGVPVTPYQFARYSQYERWIV